MKYEDIVAGFRALQASDFDDENTSARGRERLAELTDALMSVSEPEQAVPEMFRLIERLSDAHLGSPGPLVHTMERWRGRYEDELVNSIRRRPTKLSVWMVNRILNSDLPRDTRRLYMSLLNEAATHPAASEPVRESARHFIEFQMRKA